MAEPTAEESIRRLQEKRAARLGTPAPAAPPPPPAATSAEESIRRLQEKRAARLAAPPPAPVPKPAPTPTARVPVAPPPPPKNAKKAPPAPAPARPRTLDERVAEDDAAYWKTPAGQKEAQDTVRKRFGADKPFSVEEAKRDLAAQRDDLPDALTEEVRLQREGLKETGDTLTHLGEQAVNQARIAAGDRALQTMRDPRTVGAAAITPALDPARRAVKQELADAERDFALASERAEAEALAKAAAERVDAAPGDLTAARRLAENLRAETATRKDGKGPSLAKQYVDKRVTELENLKRVDLEKDPAKVAEVRKKAQEQALAELAALNTEGYGIPIGRDLLFDSDSAWTALLPAREVLPSGKVARGESLPGWFFNALLGTTDAGVTTIAQAMDENKSPSLDDLAKNVGDRRSATMYTIEQDPELQADIASGDPRRVNRALLKLAPIALLEMATPDLFTFAKVAELPGGAMKAARVARGAAELLRAEEKLSPVLAVQRAAHKVEQADAATKAAKLAEEVTAARRAALTAIADAVERGDALETLPEAAAVSSPRAILAAIKRGEMPDIMGEAGEAAAVRIRDDVAARLSVDPEVQAFLNATGAAGRPLTPEVADLPHRVRLDDPLREVVEKGKAKYSAALAEAEQAARADFVKQARLAPDEAMDATRVVDIGADDARKAALAAEEAALASERALPEANARVAESRAVAAEAKKITDGTHPALQKMRKAADAVIAAQGDEPPFQPTKGLERMRVGIERAQQNLDARTMTDARRAREQAVIDRRMRQYLQERGIEELWHREKTGARAAAREEAEAALRTARDEARAAVERVELEQARLGSPDGQKIRTPDPERIAALEARIAGRQDVPMRELFAARRFDDLVAEVAQINRSLDKARKNSPANLRWRVKRRASRLAENIVDFIHPSDDLAHRSVNALWRECVKGYEGELKGINERLAAAVAEARVGSDDWSKGAREVLEEYAAPFRESVRGGGVDGACLGAAATAYLHDIDLTDANALKRLTDVVVAWAREDGADLDVLRAELRAASPKGARLRAPQEGDIMLANAVASEGAWHRMLVNADARGLTRSAEDARAANTHIDNLNGLGPVGGRAEASRGRQVMADLLVPEDYRAPLTWKELRKSDPEHVKEPLVPARTEQARLGRVDKEARQAQALREAAVASMEQVMEHTEEVLGKNVFVPRAVRDALAKQVDAVIATARIRDEPGTLLLRNFWKQAAVLGAGLSQPGQVWTDWWGNVFAVNARLGPIAATKVAGRSVLAQFLGTRFVAQGVQAADKLAPHIGKGLELVGFKNALTEALKGAKAGDTTNALARKLTFTPEVNAIAMRDPTVRIGPGGKHTALEAHDIAKAEGVFESLVAGQLTRTMDEAAHLAFGDTPFGKAKAAYFGNQRALQQCANLSATRQRLAIYYGLIEVGHEPREAARITVEVVGDLSGELHPVERGWWATVFPFWPYRKFNARRTLKQLRNPFWLTRGLKAQEGGAAVLSWYLDDSDEYGFHTESMHDEPDPEALDALRAQVHEEHPELDMASAEAEAIVAERADDLPRAITRYERLVAKLRAMPYDEAKEAWRTDPEWAWLAPYHAPDPVRGMVPEYAQDRYAVFVQENRNQAVESWYRKGAGRFERDGGEQRYWLMPADPHIGGLTEMAAVTAIASTLAASAAQDDVDFGLYNRSNLLDGVLRDPTMATLLDVGANITPEERQYGKRVPDWMGEQLLPFGLVEPYTEQRRGEDVTQERETKYGTKYVIPPSVLNAAVIFSLVAPGLFSAMEVATTTERVTGDDGRPGPSDVADEKMAVVEGLFGQKLGTFDAKTDDYLARKRSNKRVENAIEALSSQKPLFASEETLKTRDVRSAGTSPTQPEEVRRALARLAAKKLLDPQDIGALRAELVRQGVVEDEAIKLSNAEVVARFSAMR